MERYFIVWIFSWVLIGLGIVAWLAAFVVVIYALQYGPQLRDVTSQLLGADFSQFIGTTAEAGAIGIIVRLLIYGISLMASGQFLMMLMDWAEDTRVLRAYKEREMLALHKGSRLPDMWKD